MKVRKTRPSRAANRAVGIAALSLVWCGALAATQAAAAGEKAKPRKADKPDVRRFRFDYGAKLTGLREGARVRVWLPVPQDSEHQRVKLVAKDLPAEARIYTELKYGNKILYFEAKAPGSGELPLSARYKVARREVRGLERSPDAKLSEAERKKYLSPSAMVPVSGKPLALLEGLTLPGEGLELARAIYRRVEDHMRYDKSRPGYGRGDSVWACDSRFGNCTDFHSLFLSLARSRRMPAYFTIGFPLPPERGEGEIGGYHCWAYIWVDEHGWVPVDISEADKHPEMKDYYFGNLTEDRVAFSRGRDLELVPKQGGDALNYFVYPYVEVDGEPLPQEQIELSFSYQDLGKKKSKKAGK